MRKVCQTVMDSINGLTETSILVSSNKVSNTVKVNGDSSLLTRKNHKSSINSKEITSMIRSMEWAASSGKWVTNTLVIIQLMKETDGAQWSGSMAASIKASGSKASNKVLVS